MKRAHSLLSSNQIRDVPNHGACHAVSASQSASLPSLPISPLLFSFPALSTSPSHPTPPPTTPEYFKSHSIIKMGCSHELFVHLAVARSFDCPVCLEVVEDSVYLGCGGDHVLCKTCFTGLPLSYGPPRRRCPTCAEFLGGETRRSALYVNRVILALEVKCPNVGCRWSGDLRDHENVHRDEVRQRALVG